VFEVINTVIFNINPTSKPRQTRADVWKKRPVVVRYREFADELRKQAKDKNYTLEGELDITFLVPMPKSWSKKKKKEMLFKPHQQKPDIDNYLKAFMDALAKNDSFVHTVKVSKKWDTFGSIIVEEYHRF
jgi:Holliday junction resolvase RusA-like endonuclease